MNRLQRAYRDGIDAIARPRKTTLAPPGEGNGNRLCGCGFPMRSYQGACEACTVKRWLKTFPKGR